MHLRQITIKDKLELKSVFFESIISIDDKFYSKHQKFAWSSQAWENKEFDRNFIKGNGWVIEINSKLEAFAIRYPSNRLSLLYCKSNSKGKGLGTRLLKKIEEDAKKNNIDTIYTEASLMSYRLLLKNEWKIIRKEKFIIKDTIFYRYKMYKDLY